MKLLSNILGIALLGSIGFLFLSSRLKRDGMEYVVAPATFFFPLALAWASDRFFPQYGREVRDAIIGICGAQWLAEFFKFLG